MIIEHKFADVNGVRLHYACAGKGTVILFVHGFPEFWYAWKEQLQEFANDYCAVAVDMRGYNLSSKPAEVAQYSIDHMVADIDALADHLNADKLVLVAHDWGGVVAWLYAMKHPDRVRKLVIINAPHPAIFQRELRNNLKQKWASKYMLLFRSPVAERLLRADNFAIFRKGILEKGLAKDYFTEADREEYLKAWSQPGALTGGLNWYRASDTGRRVSMQPVRAPTLVIWGEQDKYLVVENLVGLEKFVPDLTVRRFPDADHWIVHAMPQTVNELMREFLNG